MFVLEEGVSSDGKECGRLVRFGDCMDASDDAVESSVDDIFGTSAGFCIALEVGEEDECGCAWSFGGGGVTVCGKGLRAEATFFGAKERFSRGVFTSVAQDY